MAESPGTLMARLLAEAQNPGGTSAHISEQTHEENLRTVLALSNDVQSSMQPSKAASSGGNFHPGSSTAPYNHTQLRTGTTPSVIARSSGGFDSGLPPGFVLPPTMRMQVQQTQQQELLNSSVAMKPPSVIAPIPTSLAIPNSISRSNSSVSNTESMSTNTFTSSLPSSFLPPLPTRPRVINENRQYFFSKPKTEKDKIVQSRNISVEPQIHHQHESGLSEEASKVFLPTSLEPEVFSPGDVEKSILAVEELESFVKQRLEQLMKENDQQQAKDGSFENMLMLSNTQNPIEETSA